jgi:hypothetical protein
VQDGLGAVKAPHRDGLDLAVRASFGDSLDLDEALRPGHDQENRWDYLLGHAPSGQVIAVEPHSAKQDEISTVIRKRQAAEVQLREHLADGARVSRWLWVASGKVHFAATEKAMLRLDQAGIEFVGTRILSRHLPAAAAPASARRNRPVRKVKR